MKAAPMKERPAFPLMKQTDIQSVFHLQMPRWLFTDPAYRSISLEAKVVYTFLPNRFQLSRLNGWTNDSGEVFIIYTRASLAEEIQISYHKVLAAMKELAAAKMIWEKRCGRGDANQIYLAFVEHDKSDLCNLNLKGAFKMKKSKKFLSVLCAVCMILAMAAPAFAAEDLNSSLRTKPYNNTTFTVGADSKSYTLDIVTGEPCIRVWAKNTDTQGSFVVQLINTNGTSKGSTIELAPGESDSFDFTFAGTSDETWKIQISKKSGDIAKVSGMFAVRMESDWTKFD